MNSLRLRLVGMSVVVLALSVGLAAAGGDQDKGKSKGKGKGKGQGPEIVQIDLSTLPPAIAQYLRDHLKATPAPKGKDMKKDDKKGKGEPKNKDDNKKGKGKGKEETKGGMQISLNDAIRIAEKTGLGTVTKAERRNDKGEPPFRVELANKEGARTKLSLDAAGRILNLPSTPPEAPKKKKKSD